MARLGYFVVCEDVQPVTNKENAIIQALINPLLAVQLPFLPTTYTLAFSLGITDIAGDGPYQLKIEISNKESGEIAYELSDTLMAPKEMLDSLEKSESDLVFFQLGGPLKNILFKSTGKYEIKVYFENVEIANYPIKVSSLEGGKAHV